MSFRVRVTEKAAIMKSSFPYGENKVVKGQGEGCGATLVLPGNHGRYVTLPTSSCITQGQPTRGAEKVKWSVSYIKQCTQSMAGLQHGQQGVQGDC